MERTNWMGNAWHKLVLILVWLPYSLTGQPVAGDLSAMRFRHLVQTGDFTEARAMLELQSSEFKARYDVSESLVWLLLTEGRLDDALSTARRMIGFNPAKGYYMMAVVSARSGNYEVAVDYLDRHLQWPDHYAEKSIKLDDEFRVLEDLRSWVALFKRDYFASWEPELAGLEYEAKRERDVRSLETIEDFTNRYPESSGGWVLLTRQALLLKNPTLFKTGIERIHSFDVSSNQCQIEDLVGLLIQYGEFDHATRFNNKLIQSDATHPGYQLNKALIHFLDGEQAEANRQMQLLSQAGISSGELWYQAARNMAESNNAQALTYIDEAIGSGVFDKRVYNLRAELLAVSGRNLEAISDLSMSLDIDANQADAWFQRAELRFDLGDRDGACHDYERALYLRHRKAADRLASRCR